MLYSPRLSARLSLGRKVASVRAGYMLVERNSKLTLSGKDRALLQTTATECVTRGSGNSRNLNQFSSIGRPIEVQRTMTGWGRTRVSGVGTAVRSYKEDSPL